MAATDIKGKVAIVTGASSGIGEAIALNLADKGVKVALLARRLDKLRDLENKIKAKGGKALAVECDVSDKDQVFAAADKVRKDLGKIDILVNNAAISGLGLMKNRELDKWLKTVAVNVNGPLHCYAATIEDMIERKGGHIINISSVAGRQTVGIAAIYSGSKYFMQGHSAGMRQELASYGIKVTVIQPGVVKTEMLLHSKNEPDFKEFMEQGNMKEKFSKEPILESGDIAEAVIFALTQPDRVGINEIMVEPKTFVFNTV